MTQNLNAEVISIGTEILLGELTDTNSVFIARVLRDLGINLYFMTSVGDNQLRISDAIRTALARADVVITCGGLGPTVDDVTRESVAAATDRALAFHQSLLDQIAERFAGFKVKMTENNRRQAFLPEDAILIENPVGTAPAFIVEQGDGAVISLPGVPREMKYLMTERVIPYLRERYNLGIIKARILKTAGIGESSLDDMIGTDLLEQSNPTIGLAAHHGQVDIRVTAKAEQEALADQMIAEMEARIRERVGDFIFGADDDVLETVLVDLLNQRDDKLAVVQAGIGSPISDLIVAAPGGGDVLALKQVFDAPALMSSTYGFDEVSLRDQARSIAEQVSQESGATVGIVVVSNPDIDEDADDVESTIVVVYANGRSRERVYGFGGKSEIVREWVARWALSSAWRMIKEKDDVAG